MDDLTPGLLLKVTTLNTLIGQYINKEYDDKRNIQRLFNEVIKNKSVRNVSSKKIPLFSSLRRYCRYEAFPSEDKKEKFEKKFPKTFRRLKEIIKGCDKYKRSVEFKMHIDGIAQENPVQYSNAAGEAAKNVDMKEVNALISKYPTVNPILILNEVLDSLLGILGGEMIDEQILFGDKIVKRIEEREDVLEDPGEVQETLKNWNTIKKEIAEEAEGTWEDVELAAGTAEAVEVEANSDEGAAASGKPAASSTGPTTEVTDGAAAREVVPGAATKVTDSGAAARERIGCVSDIDDQYVVYLKPLTVKGNGFYTIPGEPHKFSLQDHSQRKDKTFNKFDELWTINDDTKSGAYNLKISNGEFMGLRAFHKNDKMKVYRIEQGRSPFEWDNTLKKHIPNSKRITILTDSVTEGELLNLMFVDSNVTDSHMVIAPKKFKKSLEYVCEIKLGTFQGYSSETQTISFTRKKKTNENWTVRRTAGDGWCGWHAIFVGLHKEGVRKYSGIDIAPDASSQNSVSLTDVCKTELQKKIQEQSRELFPRDRRVSDAIEKEEKEEEEENVQLEMAQDIRTIIYYLRRDSTNPVDLTVNVLDETNLGGIQVFSTPPVFRKGRAITLNIKFSGKVGKNSNHFELCKVTNGPSGASASSPSGPSDDAESGILHIIADDADLDPEDNIKERIKHYLDTGSIIAVYPQPDENKDLSFSQEPGKENTNKYTGDWLFQCYLKYTKLLDSLGSQYRDKWNDLFRKIWTGEHKISKKHLKRVKMVSKKLKKYIQILISDLEGVNPNIQTKKKSKVGILYYNRKKNEFKGGRNFDLTMKNILLNLNKAWEDRNNQAKWDKTTHWIWAVYPQPDNNTNVSFKKQKKQILFDYTEDYIFKRYKAYSKLLNQFDGRFGTAYSVMWVQLFKDIWLGDCRIMEGDTDRVCGVSKKLKQKIGEIIPELADKEPKIQTPQRPAACLTAPGAAAMEREKKRRKTKRNTEELETRFANILF